MQRSSVTRNTVVLLALLLSSGPLRADGDSPVIHWGFDGDAGATHDSVSGSHRFVAGVSGPAMVFDGYTTAVTRDASGSPDLRGGFTIAGWIAIAAYPWGHVPIVDQSSTPCTA